MTYLFWQWAFAGSCALAAAVTLYSLGQLGLRLERRWRLLRATRQLRAPGPAPTRPFDPYGLDAVPWEWLRLGGAVGGVALVWALVGERQPYLAVLGLLGAYAPSVVRGYLLRRGQHQIEAQVRYFLRFLGNATTIYGGLWPALQALGQFGGRALVLTRLRVQLRTAFSAEEALARLAAELRSPTLHALTRRLNELAGGRETPEAALLDLLGQAERSMLQAAKEAIGGAPLRLLIPMLIFMVPPVLILALNPPVAKLLALIGGVGGNAGW